jgi:hypothetical protein
MEEVSFCTIVMAWNRGRRLSTYWNALEWRKSVFAGLGWLGIKEVGFGPTIIAWNGGSLF